MEYRIYLLEQHTSHRYYGDLVYITNVIINVRDDQYISYITDGYTLWNILCGKYDWLGVLTPYDNQSRLSHLDVGFNHRWINLSDRFNLEVGNEI